MLVGADGKEYDRSTVISMLHKFNRRDETASMAWLLQSFGRRWAPSRTTSSASDPPPSPARSQRQPLAITLLEEGTLHFLPGGARVVSLPEDTQTARRRRGGAVRGTSSTCAADARRVPQPPGGASRRTVRDGGDAPPDVAAALAPERVREAESKRDVAYAAVERQLSVLAPR